MQRRVSTVLLIVSMVCSTAMAGGLRPGDRLAIIGDSITEAKQYSVMVHCYLLMCTPFGREIDVMQLGWGGETSWGFLDRIDNDCLRFRPTIATLCYGMNDGGYGPGLNSERLERFRESTRGIVQKLRDAGARVVIGSPGVVDLNTAFGKDAEKARTYNQTLRAYRDAAEELARELGTPFADVHSAMLDVMLKSHERFGKAYHLAGADGVHPAANGHLVMAWVFLRALGCDGEIGTIEVDAARGSATASPGHRVVEFDGQSIEIESSRYPFVVLEPPGAAGNLDSPTNPRGILDFLPFHEDLNRLKLVVRGIPPEVSRATVTWGDVTREYTAEALLNGINLAAEFPDNPFKEQFLAVEKAVRARQAFETVMIKSLVHGVAFELPGEESLLQNVVDACQKRRTMLGNRILDTFVPVRHTIRLEWHR
jgi:hypothetical protein